MWKFRAPGLCECKQIKEKANQNILNEGKTFFFSSNIQSKKYIRFLNFLSKYQKKNSRCLFKKNTKYTKNQKSKVGIGNIKKIRPFANLKNFKKTHFFIREYQKYFHLDHICLEGGIVLFRKKNIKIFNNEKRMKSESLFFKEEGKKFSTLWKRMISNWLLGNLFKALNLFGFFSVHKLIFFFLDHFTIIVFFNGNLTQFHNRGILIDFLFHRNKNCQYYFFLSCKEKKMLRYGYEKHNHVLKFFYYYNSGIKRDRSAQKREKMNFHMYSNYCDNIFGDIVLNFRRLYVSLYDIREINCQSKKTMYFKKKFYFFHKLLTKISNNQRQEKIKKKFFNTILSLSNTNHYTFIDYRPTNLFIVEINDKVSNSFEIIETINLPFQRINRNKFNHESTNNSNNTCQVGSLISLNKLLMINFWLEEEDSKKKKDRKLLKNSKLKKIFGQHRSIYFRKIYHFFQDINTKGPLPLLTDWIKKISIKSLKLNLQKKKKNLRKKAYRYSNFIKCFFLHRIKIFNLKRKDLKINHQTILKYNKNLTRLNKTKNWLNGRIGIPSYYNRLISKKIILLRGLIIFYQKKNKKHIYYDNLKNRKKALNRRELPIFLIINKESQIKKRNLKYSCVQKQNGNVICSFIWDKKGRKAIKNSKLNSEKTLFTSLLFSSSKFIKKESICYLKRIGFCVINLDQVFVFFSIFIGENNLVLSKNKENNIKEKIIRKKFNQYFLNFNYSKSLCFRKSYELTKNLRIILKVVNFWLSTKFNSFCFSMTFQLMRNFLGIFVSFYCRFCFQVFNETREKSETFCPYELIILNN